MFTTKINSVTKRFFCCIENKKISILGIPLHCGQKKSGVNLGPEKIRNKNLINNLQGLGYNVKDYGDLKFPKKCQNKKDFPLHNIKYPRSMGMASKQVDMIQNIAKENNNNETNIILSLGGDHSIGIGSVHGHCSIAKANDCELSVIWVDAHADINTPLTSTTGNLHGMPLSFLLKELDEYMPKIIGFEWLKACLKAKNLCYIGLRSIDAAEHCILDKFNIKYYTMSDIDLYGIGKIVEMALNDVNPNLKNKILLSFDIDSLNPTIAPSTGTPVENGLSIREGMLIAELIGNTGKLQGIDIVEVNPKLGSKVDQRSTIKSARNIISACFGKRWKNLSPTNYLLPKPIQK